MYICEGNLYLIILSKTGHVPRYYNKDNSIHVEHSNNLSSTKQSYIFEVSRVLFPGRTDTDKEGEIILLRTTKYNSPIPTAILEGSSTSSLLFFPVSSVVAHPYHR